MLPQGYEDMVPHPALEGLLVFVLGAVVFVDFLLLGDGPGAGLEYALRQGLAVAAFTIVFFALVIGYRRPRSYATGAIFATPLVVAYAYTGLILPGTARSTEHARSMVETVLAVPVFGEDLAYLLFDGVTLSEHTLDLVFVYHYALVGTGLLTLFALIFLAINRQRALARLHRARSS